MAYNNIIYEKDAKDKRIATITLNRPEKLNALSEDLLEELAAAVDEVDNDEESAILVIKGAGRAFCAGYDISGGGKPYVAPNIGDTRRRMIRCVEQYLRLWNLRKPTIAQVHGYCLSGATELISMCDIVIAADDAQFGHVFGRMGGTLRTGGLWPYLIGMRKSKELMLTGDTINAKKAEAWGLINAAVPADILEEEVYDMARRIIRIPTEILSLHKGMLNQFYDIMGIHPAMMSSLFYDAASAFVKGPVFGQLSKEKGLREALRMRDDPWREYKRVTLPKK